MSVAIQLETLLLSVPQEEEYSPEIEMEAGLSFLDATIELSEAIANENTYGVAIAIKSSVNMEGVSIATEGVKETAKAFAKKTLEWVNKLIEFIKAQIKKLFDWIKSKFNKGTNDKLSTVTKLIGSDEGVKAKVDEVLNDTETLSKAAGASSEVRSEIERVLKETAEGFKKIDNAQDAVEESQDQNDAELKKLDDVVNKISGGSASNKIPKTPQEIIDFAQAIEKNLDSGGRETKEHLDILSKLISNTKDLIQAREQKIENETDEKKIRDHNVKINKYRIRIGYYNILISRAIQAESAAGNVLHKVAGAADGSSSDQKTYDSKTYEMKMYKPKLYEMKMYEPKLYKSK